MVQNDLSHKFQAIIGYEDIPNNAQKPTPFGGIKCLEQIFEDKVDKTIFYIGDHEGDVEFARNISKELNERSKVIAIVAKYSRADTINWNHKPDFDIERPIDLIEIINNYS